MKTFKNIDLNTQKPMLKKLTNQFSTQIKEFKTWADLRSPKFVRPTLQYTLNWLNPEMLGSGFRVVQMDSNQLSATIPAMSGNFDFQKQIHQGLVLNASLEMAQIYLHQIIDRSGFEIMSSESKIIKKNIWKEDLTLELTVNQKQLDDFFIEFDQNDKADISFEIKVKSKSFSKTDYINLKFKTKKLKWLSGGAST